MASLGRAFIMHALCESFKLLTAATLSFRVSSATLERWEEMFGHVRRENLERRARLARRRRRLAPDNRTVGLRNIEASQRVSKTLGPF